MQIGTLGAVTLKTGGYLQTDGRFVTGHPPQGTNGFFVRRARLIFEASAYDRLELLMMPDFGGGNTVLQYGYLELHMAGVGLRAGKYKAPLGLERLQSDPQQYFIEPGPVTDLVPNRDVGVAFVGNLLGQRLDVTVGVFNGAPDGGSIDTPPQNAKTLDARVFVQPFARGTIAALAGLGFGVAGSAGYEHGSLDAPGLPSLRTDGGQPLFSYRSTTIANGNHTRVVPQAYWAFGPVGVLAEYVRSVQGVSNGASRADLASTAWDVEATWSITGEHASYRGIVPDDPLDRETGGFGALELAARVGAIDFDDASFPVFADPAKSASAATEWAVAVNWYADRNFRAWLDFFHTSFTGGAAGDRPIEQVVSARVQAQF